MIAYTLLYLKWVTSKDPLHSTGNSVSITWQLCSILCKWEKNLRKNRYMHMYSWIPLQHTWNYHIMNQVCVSAKSLQLCLTLQPNGQAPLPMGFSRQEYWSGLPCPPPGDLPDRGIEPASLRSVSCTGKWVLNHEGHLGSLINYNIK